MTTLLLQLSLNIFWCSLHAIATFFRVHSFPQTCTEKTSTFLYFSLVCTINAIKVELNNLLKSSLITKASTSMLSLSKNALRKQGRWEVILVEVVLHSIQCSEWAGGPCPDANDGSVCWNVQQFKPGWGSGCVYVGVYDGSVSWKVQNVQMFKIWCLGVCVCVCVPTVGLCV